MDDNKLSNKEIFNNFKKNNTPLPIIQLKINQQNKDIEKILREMDKNYEMMKPIQKKENKYKKKTRNKKSILKDDRTIEKIDFGPATYLTYKENIDDDISLRRYNFEFLRQKILNSNNLRFGYFNKNYQNFKVLNKIKLNEQNPNNKKKNKNRINISPYINNKIKSKNVSNNYIISETDNFLETKSNTNRDLNNYKSAFKELINISLFNENNKEKNESNTNINENNFIFDNTTNKTSRNSHLSYKNNSLTNRTNITKYSSKKYNTNNNSSTNYLEKKKPIDLKETIIHNKSKTSSNFNDYKDLFKYYRTNSNFLINSNNNSNINKSNNSNNNIQSKPFTLLNNQIIYIDENAKSHKKKLNNIARKKLNIKKIEKILNKDEFSNSIIKLLSNGKKHKIKLRTNFNKIKKQVEHLSLVDKVEKYSDSIPSEKLKTFNRHYNDKCKKIGITNNNITLRNGKIYHQPKSDSKKLYMRITKNCDEIYKLAEQILIDRYYFEEKDSKCSRLLEKVLKEKINLSINKK